MKSRRENKGGRENAPGSTKHRRLQPALRALKAIHSVANPSTLTPADLALQRKGQELLGRLIAPKSGVDWVPVAIGGIPAAWTKPEHAPARDQIILYCHGGGYTSGNLGYAQPLAAKLALATGYEVLSFEYRLAPEYPYPAALSDALSVWDSLMHLGFGARDVIVAGDSAGGNLALCLTLRLKEQERRLPRALVLLSPWTDMTHSGKSYAGNAELDPILNLDYVTATRAAYAPDGDYASPLLSPLFGDLSGFPPVLIQAGELEILLSDSVRLRDRLLAAGSRCRLEVWRGMWHVFQMFPMRQANQAMESIGAFAEDLEARA